MTYAEAVARILALRGGERAGMRPGLERIEALLDAIGRPEQTFTIAQVGGTNGKGSTSAMLAAILQASGRRVGLYTSPHLRHYRERIRVDGRPISEADFVDGVEALGTLVARLDATVFEAGTALALDHFCRARVDVAVLEVGLGGRLDATTVGRPEVVVLGPIDYDHQLELGDTLTAIAGEKAAIIRGGTAFSARQDPEAAAVIERRAAQVGVPLQREGHELRVVPRGFTLEAQRLDLAGPDWALDDVACGLLGVFQPGNALLAAAAARALGAGDAAIRAGLRAARWPGRFQVFRRDPIVILDGAHNPAGARALAASLSAYFPGRPVTFVIGILADKDGAGILSALRPLAARVVLTASGNPRAAAPGALRALLPPALPVEIAASPSEALARATAEAGAGIVCVAGSLSLIGDVLAAAGDGQDVLFTAGARC
jgi:dihydrofolate synthase/folylpolyglutamate synthase